MSEYTNEVVKKVSETRDRNGFTEKTEGGQYTGIKGTQCYRVNTVCFPKE